MATALRGAAHIMTVLRTPVLCIVLLAGCQPAERSADTKVAESVGLRLAIERTVTVCSADNQTLGCATVVGGDEHHLYLASSAELFLESGRKLVVWRELETGQKFERQELPGLEVLEIHHDHKLAIIKVPGTLVLPQLNTADSSTPYWRRPFVGYGARVGKVRPLEAVKLKAVGITAARAGKNTQSADFIRVDSGIDFKMLGSPFVSEYGEMVGVAVGHFWDAKLYCPADKIEALLRHHLPQADGARRD